MKARLHEYGQNEEFYARFIHIRAGERSVLVFNYELEDRALAEQIAALMGEPEWDTSRDIDWDDDL